MKQFLLPLATLLFVAPVCYAESVYKCTTEAAVTFQSTPCIEGAAQVLALRPSVKADARPDEDAAASPAATAPFTQVAIHSRSDELQPGMSDMQVLNNRRWGKPQRITRNREARAWHEYWNYETGANGGKKLHFVNGRLASIEDLQPPAPAVTVSMMSVVLPGER